MVANTGDGEKEVVANGNQDMVASSESSLPKGRKRTTKTVSLTPEQALEILQQSLIECQAAGLDIKTSNLYHQGTRSMAIIVANVEFVGGNLRLIGGSE